MYFLVGIMPQCRYTHWIPNTQHVGLNHAARNVGSVKKKDVEGELGRISEQTLVVHVVQRNVKARTADTPLILVNF